METRHFGTLLYTARSIWISLGQLRVRTMQTGAFRIRFYPGTGESVTEYPEWAKRRFEQHDRVTAHWSAAIAALASPDPIGFDVALGHLTAICDEVKGEALPAGEASQGR